MKTLHAIAIAITLMAAQTAMAQTAMSKDEYHASKDRISAEHKTASATCSSLSGNAKDICAVDAKGKNKVAMADLEAAYQPSVKNHYEARAAQADASYAVAKEKCDDQSGNAKDVCVKKAKAQHVSELADAKLQMKTSDAKSTANEKSATAQAKASSQVIEARKEATEDKTDANYKTAIEKCDTYSGAAKDNCVNQAKTQFKK